MASLEGETIHVNGNIRSFNHTSTTTDKDFSSSLLDMFQKEKSTDLHPAPEETHKFIVTDPKTGDGHKGPVQYFFDAITYTRWKNSCNISDKSKDELKTHKKEPWQARLSLLLLKILWFVNVPLTCLGLWVEFILNVLIANKGVLETFWRLIFWWRGNLVIPERDSEDFVSIIGALDPRYCLFVDSSEQGDNHSDKATSSIFPGPDHGARKTADILVLSSKLAYENKNYIKKVVNTVWKMNFVEFYECWNEYQEQKSTQVFIATDQPKDARAIVVAWRGTELFNALDWSTDLDFSWFEVPELGNVHVGFLEALGLGTRTKMESFVKMTTNARAEGTGPISGLSAAVREDPNKIQAFDLVTEKLKELMDVHKDAKLFVTGHSLGGALAALYTTLLFFKGENSITDRLAALYTFGQPRVGDEAFCSFMTEKITYQRYWRVVYCNDLVPRVPFDDLAFRFKHSGYTFYFDAQYTGKTLENMPNSNYFSFSILNLFETRVVALYEVFVSMFAAVIYGPQYRENFTSTLTRVVGLISPGIAAHIMNNYVNAIRLGPSPLQAKLYEKEKQIEAKWKRFLCFSSKIFHKDHKN